MHDNSKLTAQVHDWYCSYHGQLMNMGVRFGYPREEVNDVIHQFFLDLLEKKINITRIAHPYAYISVAFKRKLIDRRRKAVEQSFIPVEEVADSLEELSFQEQLDLVLADQELIATVRKAYKKLPMRCRKVLRLKYFEGRSTDEISAVTGLSRRSVYNNIFEGVKLLRKEVARAPLLFYLTALLLLLSLIMN